MKPTIEQLLQQKMNNAESFSFSADLKDKMMQNMRELKNTSTQQAPEQASQLDKVSSASNVAPGWYATVFSGAASGIKTILISGIVLMSISAAVLLTLSTEDKSENEYIQEQQHSSGILPIETDAQSITAIENAIEGESIEASIDVSIDAVSAVAIQSKAEDNDDNEAAEIVNLNDVGGITEMASEKKSINRAIAPTKSEKQSETVDELSSDDKISSGLLDAGLPDEIEEPVNAELPEIVSDVAEVSAENDDVVSEAVSLGEKAEEDAVRDSAPVYIKQTYVEPDVKVKFRKQKARVAKRRKAK